MYLGLQLEGGLPLFEYGSIFIYPLLTTPYRIISDYIYNIKTLDLSTSGHYSHPVVITNSEVDWDLSLPIM